MDDEKFLRNVDQALGKWLGEGGEEIPPFGGKPGEPVPAVDPEDVKTVWQLGLDAQARGANAIGDTIIKQACKPGADIPAVSYRTSFLWMMTQMPPVILERFMRNGRPNDAAFRAAAKVPTEWMREGVRQGPLFDVNEFMRLCGEETGTD